MKKIISLLFVLVICLSLCACSQCNCGCCEKIATEAAVSESVPEEARSREEYLAELLISEKWLANNIYRQKNERYTFLKNGYGIKTWANFGLSDSGAAFQWVLDENKLLLIFEDSGDAHDVDWLFTYDEEKNIFTCLENTVETRVDVEFYPESRMDEFN